MHVIDFAKLQEDNFQNPQILKKHLDKPNLLFLSIPIFTFGHHTYASITKANKQHPG